LPATVESFATKDTKITKVKKPAQLEGDRFSLWPSCPLWLLNPVDSKRAAMERELIDRTAALHDRILQLRDSL
jgi:hypothetical protein